MQAMKTYRVMYHETGGNIQEKAKKELKLSEDCDILSCDIIDMLYPVGQTCFLTASDCESAPARKAGIANTGGSFCDQQGIEEADEYLAEAKEKAEKLLKMPKRMRNLNGIKSTTKFKHCRKNRTPKIAVPFCGKE